MLQRPCSHVIIGHWHPSSPRARWASHVEARPRSRPSTVPAAVENLSTHGMYSLYNNFAPQSCKRFVIEGAARLDSHTSGTVASEFSLGDLTSLRISNVELRGWILRAVQVYPAQPRQPCSQAREAENCLNPSLQPDMIFSSPVENQPERADARIRLDGAWRASKQDRQQLD